MLRFRAGTFGAAFAGAAALVLSLKGQTSSARPPLDIQDVGLAAVEEPPTQADIVAVGDARQSQPGSNEAILISEPTDAGLIASFEELHVECGHIVELEFRIVYGELEESDVAALDGGKVVNEFEHGAIDRHLDEW